MRRVRIPGARVSVTDVVQRAQLRVGQRSIELQVAFDRGADAGAEGILADLHHLVRVGESLSCFTRSVCCPRLPSTFIGCTAMWPDPLSG